MPAKWLGDTVALVATGPSLTPADVDYLRGKCRVVVISDSYRLAPWADVLYSCDHAWWECHGGCPDFPGARWTQRPRDVNSETTRKQLACIEKYGLNVVDGIDRPSISVEAGLIHYGHNSGFQALNLAVLFGAARILLLGFDMKRSRGGAQHWFGDHPAGLLKNSPYDKFCAAFASAADDLARLGVEVVNCTANSALECFTKIPLRSAI